MAGPTPIFPYDELLLSGRPIYVQSGVDYQVTTDRAIRALREAARIRGLRIVVRAYPGHDGFMFQAYLRGSWRPTLPDFTPPPVTKKTHAFLYCSDDGCDHLLRPSEYHLGKCAEHRETPPTP